MNITLEDKDRMNFENIGGLEIFHPSDASEIEMDKLSENNLRSKFLVGRYSKKEEVNEIIQHQFNFYENILNELIPLVASRNFLEFILSNYDTSTQIEILYNDHKLNKSDSIHWLRIGKSFRRATKYIAEQVVLLQPDENTKAEDNFLVSIAEKIQICAEEMITLYIVSDQTHSIFPNETYLEIFPVGNKDFFFQGLTRELPDDNSRLRLDVTNRNRFISSPDFLLNSKKHNEIIGQVVKKTIGITYEEALGVVYQVIEGALPPTGVFSVPFVSKVEFIAILSKELKFPKESIEKAIAGFSLSKKQMETEGRQAWNSKQEYRAYRRAFFEMPHPLGTHITFSKYMAKECLTLFLKDVAFKRFPKEWLSPSVDIALSKLSNRAGKWFEDIVEENIKVLGYKGIKSARKGIGFGDSRIKIPNEVGEIDYIGYSETEKVLLVVECKLVRDSFEPKLFRDDLDDFVNSKKSYAKKFRKKFNWVTNNVEAISESLESTNLFKYNIEPKNISKIMITFFPTIVTHFIEDFPCVSMTEFMMDYEAMKKYPYEIGVDLIS